MSRCSLELSQWPTRQVATIKVDDNLFGHLSAGAIVDVMIAVHHGTHMLQDRLMLVLLQSEFGHDTLSYNRRLILLTPAMQGVPHKRFVN